MSKNKILDSIFQNFLDSKKATVSSEGLYIEGRAQDEVTLKYHSERGLICLGNLSNNTVKVSDELESIFAANRERMKFSLDTHEKISELLNLALQDVNINYGTIASHGVKNFVTETDDQGEISKLSIVYEKGSTVRIYITPGPLR